MPCEGIDECSAEIAASGVYYHSCGFVDDEQDVIFIDDVEGYVLGDYLPVSLRPVEHEGYDVPSLDLVVAFYGFAVGLDEACLGGLLYAVAAGVPEVVHEKAVDAHGILSAIGNDATMFVQPGGE